MGCRQIWGWLGEGMAEERAVGGLVVCCVWLSDEVAYSVWLEIYDQI